MAVKENEKIAKASQEWEYLRGDEAVKRMAFLREKWERDWNSGMHSAEEAGIEKGMKEGLEKGKKEGEKIGREIGEKSKAENVAIKMLQKEMDEVIIAEVTNLTLEEIQKIKERLKKKYKNKML